MYGFLPSLRLKLGLSSKPLLMSHIYVPNSAPNGTLEFPKADPLSGFSAIRDGHMITCAENNIAASCASLRDVDNTSSSGDDDGGVDFARDGCVRDDFDVDDSIEVNTWATVRNWLNGGVRLVKGVFMGDHRMGFLRSGRCEVGRTVETRDAEVFVEVLVVAEAEGYMEEDILEVIRPRTGVRRELGGGLSSTQLDRDVMDFFVELDEGLGESRRLGDDLAFVEMRRLGGDGLRDDRCSAEICKDSRTLLRGENSSRKTTEIDGGHELRMLDSVDMQLLKSKHHTQITPMSVITATNTTTLTTNNTPTLSAHQQDQSLQNLPIDTKICMTANKTSSTVPLPETMFDAACLLEIKRALAASRSRSFSRSRFSSSKALQHSSPRKSRAPQTLPSAFPQRAKPVFQPAPCTFPGTGRNLFSITNNTNLLDSHTTENNKINIRKQDGSPGKRKRGTEAASEEEDDNDEWVMVERPLRKEKRRRTSMDARTCAGMGLNMGMGSMVLAC
ncbi:hypothetical protein ACMFMG_008947 [Clarireedia jacksonii]